jgi:acyl carrier protein
MAPSLFRKIASALSGGGSAEDAASPSAGEPAQPDSARTAELIAALREVVVRNGDGEVQSEDVAADDHLLYANHMDSMAGASLLTFIEDSYGVHIEDFELVEDLSTLRALARHIEKREGAA